MWNVCFWVCLSGPWDFRQTEPMGPRGYGVVPCQTRAGLCSPSGVSCDHSPP